MASSTTGAHLLIQSRMQDALRGDPGACFDLGIALSSGSGEDGRINLVEAHKWFTLAVQAGYEAAAKSRAKIAWDMSAREIAEAQRRSRLALMSNVRQVARFSASVFA